MYRLIGLRSKMLLQLEVHYLILNWNFQVIIWLSYSFPAQILPKMKNLNYIIFTRRTKMTVSNLWLQIHVLGNISKGINRYMFYMKIYLSYSHRLTIYLYTYICICTCTHTCVSIHTHIYEVFLIKLGSFYILSQKPLLL